MKELKQFSKNVVSYGLGRGIQKFIGMFLMPFYTRALTPADYGILETISVGVFFVTAILNLGADSASARYFYMAKTEGEKGKILFNTLVFRLLAVIPSLIIALFSQQISLFLFKTTEYTWVVFLSCMTMPLQLLYSEQEHIYRYYFEPWKFNIVNFAKILSHIGLGISFVVIMKKGVFGAQLATFVSSLVLFLTSYFLFNRKRYTYKFSWYWAKKMLNYGFPLIFAGVAGWFYISSDRYFLLYYSTTTDIGLYSVGGKISQAMNILAMAVQMSWGPIIVSVFENDSDKEKSTSKNLLSQGWRLFLAVSLTLSLFLSIFGLNIMKILTTQAYYMGALVIPFLLLSKVCSQSIQMTGSGISLYEKTKHFAWITPTTAIVNIGLNFYFIPKFSYVGAAFTTLIASMVNLTITYNLSQKYFFVDRKIKKVIFYAIIVASVAIFFPFAELKYNISISLINKVVIFIVSLTFPFLTGMININILKLAYDKLIRVTHASIG